MPVATWLLVLVNGAVLFGAVLAVAYLLRRRDGTGMDSEEWRREARKLTEEVQSTAASVDRPADHDEVSRRLLPLAARIAGHVRTAPASVEQTQLQAFFELGVTCERVATDYRPGETTADGPFIDDRLDSLGTRARSVEEQLATD